MRMHRHVAIRFIWLVAFGATSCATKPAPRSPAPASATETPRTLPIPPDLETKVQLSIEYGRSLYFTDKASAIGTDVMMDNVSPAERSGLGGYLTIRDGTEEGEPLPAYTVLFYTADEARFIKYRIHVPVEARKKASLEKVVPPERPVEPLLALIRARTAALKAAGPFTQSINPVVLPAGGYGESGDIMVELLAGTKKANTVVLGKHFRVLVSPDGSRVKSVTPLSKGQLELAAESPKPGATLSGLYVTHIVTDYPLETHVFASMSSGFPLYVGTSRGTWLVDRDSIQLISLPK